MKSVLAGIEARLEKKYLYILTAGALMFAYYQDGYYVHGSLVLALAFMDESDK